jgi:hypothetical protein
VKAKKPATRTTAHALSTVEERVSALEARMGSMERRMRSFEGMMVKTLQAVEVVGAKIEAWQEQDFHLRNEEIPRHLAPIMTGLNELSRRVEALQASLVEHLKPAEETGG